MWISPRQFLIFLLTFSTLVPNIGISIPTFGFVWTFYRASVLICVVLYLHMEKSWGRLVDWPAYRRWTVLLAVWLLYGSVLIVVSPYRDPHNGFVELLSVFNGLACMYMILSSLRDGNDLEMIVSIAYCVYVGLVILGLIEIVTGWHLPTAYSNDRSRIMGVRKATGTFYGENDFSTFLTCLMPILFYKKRATPLNIVILLCALFIVSVNDANICLIAMIICAGCYFIFIRRYVKPDQQGLLYCVLLLGLLVFAVVIWLNVDYLSAYFSLLRTIRTQQLNAAGSFGSLHARLVIYADSLKASARTLFLGVGPAAFDNYFYAHPSASGLLNPHNLYLEILVEYGLGIAAVFTVSVFGLVRRLRKRVLQNQNKGTRRKLLAGWAMILLYCMVCLSPSSFIGYAWQWLVLSVGIALAAVPEDKLAAEKAPLSPAPEGYMCVQADMLKK